MAEIEDVSRLVACRLQHRVRSLAHDVGRRQQGMRIEISLDRDATTGAPARLITARSNRPRTGDTRLMPLSVAAHSPPVASASPAAVSTLFI